MRLGAPPTSHKTFADLDIDPEHVEALPAMVREAR